MKTLIVDLSSIVWQGLLAGKDTEFGREVIHNEKKVWVNGWQFGLECAVNHITTVLRELDMLPREMIIVLEGEHSKARRRLIYSGYKAKRDKPEEAYPEFVRANEEFIKLFSSVGATVATQPGVESDDVIGYLVRRIPGLKYIRSNDGDMTVLLEDPEVFQWGFTGMTQANKYGPFSHRFVPVYKALCGDGDEYKGAFKFGGKSFLDMLVWAGEPAVAAIEGMIKRRTLHELEEDVEEFKPLRKIIDSAQHVYESYDCALLHDEWVNTKRQPLIITPGRILGHDMISDSRVSKWGGESGTEEQLSVSWMDVVNPPVVKIQKNHAIFDIELIGLERPVFLLCVKVIETGEKAAFWYHKEGDMTRLAAMLARPDLTWVGFNSNNFDAPLLGAALDGKDVHLLKRMANTIVNDDTLGYWQLPSIFNYSPVEFDHIDLFQTAPGVNISLKTFAGRLGYRTMIDLPFEHDQDLTEEQLPELEEYCMNDLGVTEALFLALKTEVELREDLGEEHDLDLRSKSDAQVAEAILKKAAGIGNKKGDSVPFVKWTKPAFVQTDSEIINDLVTKLEGHTFKINHANGQVISPDFLNDQIKMGWNSYQFGVGGLHSTMDKRLYLEADDEFEMSDFDVAGYYPKIMLKAGLTPRLSGGAGQRFVDEYRKIYERRIEAKRAGNKKIANALKISLNGTFGKLGNQYCPFYSPDLMLAVTIGGQLNLACVIYELEKIPSAFIVSANTDGILVRYPKAARGRVIEIFRENAMRTGFEYEETPYSKVAMKDVNNYINITDGRAGVIVSPDGSVTEVPGKAGKAKRKGLYASIWPDVNPLYLQKNPTMNVCSELACDYLISGKLPRENIANYKDMRDFVEIRNVKGGGIQYDSFVEVDDWVLLHDFGSKDNEWVRQAWLDNDPERSPVKRKSRPAPVMVGQGGHKFGRLARWYISNDPNVVSINYAGSGNKVAGTDNGRLCLALPDELPADLHLEWYIKEAERILDDIGVIL